MIFDEFSTWLLSKKSVSRRRSAAAERGAVILQTALALPVLIVIAAGIIDYTVSIEKEVGLHVAARIGARAGAALDSENACAIRAAAMATAIRALGDGAREGYRVGGRVRLLPLGVGAGGDPLERAVVEVSIEREPHWVFLQHNARGLRVTSTFVIESRLAEDASTCDGGRA